MKKNKLFILLSFFALLIFFGVAATCNFCGTPLDISIGDTETTENEEKPASQSETSATTQNSQSTEDAEEGNHPPSILDLEMGEYDLEQFEEDGYFDELPLDPGDPVSGIIFTIIATDEDGDELAYSAYDSHGRSFTINKIDNNNAELNWTTPEELGPYTLTIEVSDGRGGTDSHSIEMNFVEIPEGAALEDMSRQRLYVIPVETGMIANNSDSVLETVYVGDLSDNRYFNGYLSFDITDFSGVEVLSATLTMDSIEEEGDRSFLGALRIGALDYGTGPLSRSDGDIPAKMMVQLPNSTTVINYADDNLRAELQEKIDISDTRFQLKIYWASPHSDDDGVADGLEYHNDSIYLTFDYLN